MALLDPGKYVWKVIDQVPFLGISSKHQGHFLFEIANDVNMGLHVFKKESYSGQKILQNKKCILLISGTHPH